MCVYIYSSVYVCVHLCVCMIHVLFNFGLNLSMNLYIYTVLCMFVSIYVCVMIHDLFNFGLNLSMNLFNEISVICLNTVKWSNSSISNNSIQRKSTKLNGSKYCYVSLTIQWKISHLFKHSQITKISISNNSIYKSFVCILFKCQTVLYDQKIGPYQVLPLRAECTWERWQWRGILHSSKPQHNWNFTIRLFSVISRRLVGGEGSYPSADLQLIYSPTPPTHQLGWSSLAYSIMFLIKSVLIVVLWDPRKFYTTTVNESHTAR